MEHWVGILCVLQPYGTLLIHFKVISTTTLQIQGPSGMPNTAGISGLELRQSLAGTGGLTAIAVALLQIDA